MLVRNIKLRFIKNLSQFLKSGIQYGKLIIPLGDLGIEQLHCSICVLLWGVGAAQMCANINC